MPANLKSLGSNLLPLPICTNPTFRLRDLVYNNACPPPCKHDMIASYMQASVSGTPSSTVGSTGQGSFGYNRRRSHISIAFGYNTQRSQDSTAALTFNRLASYPLSPSYQTTLFATWPGPSPVKRTASRGSQIPRPGVSCVLPAKQTTSNALLTSSTMTRSLKQMRLRASTRYAEISP
jgi:hypothetical protein